jgi:hypothetical protein
MKLKEKHKVLSNVSIGFEFEFFSNFSTEDTRIKLQKLLGKSIKIFDTVHSEFQPTKEVFKLEPDFSGGKMLNELITGPLNYYEAILLMNKVLNWIDENGSTNEKCSIHVNINFDSSLQSNFLSHLNILKFILDFDEDKVFKYFPNRKDTVYAKSVKFIIPANKYFFDENELKNVNPKNFILPDSKYYGINFTKLIKNYLEFRYIGGKDYQKKKNEIQELIEHFIFSLYNSRTKLEYSNKHLVDLKDILLKHKTHVDAYKSYDKFKEIFKDIKLSVDMNDNPEFIKIHYFAIRDRIFDLMIKTEIKKGKINYDTTRAKIQVKDAKLNRAYSLENLDLVQCEIFGYVHNCNCYQCKFTNTDIIKSNLYSKCEAEGSKLNSCYISRSSKLKNCYVTGTHSFIGGMMDGGILRKGKITSNAKISDNVEIVEYEYLKNDNAKIKYFL